MGILLATAMGVVLPFAEAAAVPEGSAVVCAAYGTAEVDGVTYKYFTSGNTCTIYDCEARSGALNIPSELNGFTVVKIGGFANQTAFTSLTIPDTVTTIEYDAFSGCTGLRGELVIPSSVTTIGYHAFAGCKGLTGSLIIPDSVSSLGEGAFCNCTGFNGELSVNASEIGRYAFQECSGFNKLTIGENVTSIGKGAFGNCIGFSGTLTIGSRVNQIGESAFCNCAGFTGDLIIPESVRAVQNYAFEGCTGFTGNLTVSKGTVGVSAFKGCNGFKGSLTLADGVTKVDTSAFEGCAGFTGDLDLPQSLTTIGNRSFADCGGMKGTLTIPASVTSIGTNGFSGTLFTHIKNGSAVTMPVEWFNGGDGFITNDATGAEVTELPTGNYTRKANVIVEFVTRMYNVALDREPDQAGLDQWSNDLKYGTKKGADIAEGFYLSQELLGKHLSDADYVELAYKGIMDRGSDSDGKSYWVTALDAGCTYRAVVKGFVESTEFGNLCQTYRITPGTIEVTEARDKNIGVTRLVSRMYTEVLGRRPDDSGLNSWCDNILSNTTKANIIDVSTNGFLHSQEFLNKGLDDTEYVKVLYRAYLGREADQAGLNDWLSRLSNGTSRDEVAAGFAGSQEFENIMRSYGLDVH